MVVQLAEVLLPKLNEPSVREQITAELEALLGRVNGEIEVFERLDFIVVSETRWSVEGGHLTPAMKMKCPVIEDLYKQRLDEWYAAGSKVVWDL